VVRGAGRGLLGDMDYPDTRRGVKEELSPKRALLRHWWFVPAPFTGQADRTVSQPIAQSMFRVALS
jgi:hypothetical protein